MQAGVAPPGHPLGFSNKTQVDWRQQQTPQGEQEGQPGMSGQFFTGPEAQHLRVRGGTYEVSRSPHTHPEPEPNLPEV